MSNFGKVIGVVGGWAFARWDGAFAGLILGTFVDEFISGPKQQKGNPYNAYNAYSQGPVADFNYSLLALTAAVMKSDGKTTRSELDYVRSFFIRQFGVDKTRENLLILRDMLKENVPLETICIPVRQNMAYHGKVQLLHYLFGIAYADSSFSPSEESVLNRIAQMLGINMVDFKSVAAMFAPATYEAPYEILGISSSATDDEVKKAYRQMALQSHPDKVSHLGEDIRRAAEEKFKKIQAAYEEIKKSRRFA